MQAVEGAPAKGYGGIGPGEERLVAGRLLRVLGGGRGGHYVYERSWRGVRVRRLLGGVSSLVAAPAPPVFHPERFTDYVMARLATPLVICGGCSTEAFIVLKCSVLVLAEGKQPTIIDSFPLGKVQYALYGQPDSGIIAAYTLTRLMHDEPLIEWLPVVRIVFRNSTSQAVVVERIVMPTSHLQLYYRGSRVIARPLEFVVTGPGKAYVQPLQRWRPPSGFTESPRLSRELIPFTGWRFEMLHGL